MVILDAGKPSPEGDALLLDFAAAYRWVLYTSLGSCLHSAGSSAACCHVCVADPTVFLLC